MSQQYFTTKIITHFEKDPAPIPTLYLDSLRALIRNPIVLRNLDLLNLANAPMRITNAYRLYTEVQQLQEAFKLHRYQVDTRNVSCRLVLPTGNTIGADKEFRFHITDALEIDASKDEVPTQLEATSIYSSMSQFYDDRDLTKYMNYLKDMGDVEKVNDINASWAKPSDIHHKIGTKIFRIIEDNKGEYYVKSINSKNYKEYGVACVFALSAIGISNLQILHPDLEVGIYKFGISESEIDIWYKLHTTYPNKYCTIQPIIRIKSKDDRENAIHRQFVLKMYAHEVEEEGLELILPMSYQGKMVFYKTMNHTASENQVVHELTDFTALFDDVKDLLKDIENIMASLNIQELKDAIKIHLGNNKNALARVEEIKQFFTKDAFYAIANLKELLTYCGKIKSLNLAYEQEEKLIIFLSKLLLTKS